MKYFNYNLNSLKNQQLTRTAKNVSMFMNMKL